VDGWWDDVPLSTGPLASRIVSCANPEQKEHDMHTVFVGHDWAEDHHDIHIESSDGGKLHTCRLDDGLDGVRQLHAVLAKLAEDPAEVLIATETDRGLFIAAMVAAGYAVIAINPMSTARYRERHSTSGAKSDRADAQVLAEVARLDGHNHRLLEPDSALADAIKHTARAHQNLIWTRQRQLNQLRSVLREFFPAALATFPELTHSDCLATLAIAPTPAAAEKLTTARIAAALRRGGRRRSAEAKAVEIRAALRADQLRAPSQLETAMGSHVTAMVAVATELSRQVERLEVELAELVDQHDDGDLLRSIPALGTKLAARMLGEFGDAPNRFVDARSRKNYAGTSPITKASGRSHVVIARRTRNTRLADACHQWAFASLSHSPGARAFYDERRARGDSHNRALRALSNRLVGILHGCLTHRTPYDEHTAWGHRQPATT
jgi:transposase